MWILKRLYLCSSLVSVDPSAYLREGKQGKQMFVSQLPETQQPNDCASAETSRSYNLYVSIKLFPCAIHGCSNRFQYHNPNIHFSLLSVHVSQPGTVCLEINGLVYVALYSDWFPLSWFGSDFELWIYVLKFNSVCFVFFLSMVLKKAFFLHHRLCLVLLVDRIHI